MRLSLITAAIFVAAAPALAQQQGQGFEWKLNDKTAPLSPSQASKNGFGVLMLVTDDPEGFMKAWAGSTPPHVTTSSKVTLAKPVEMMLLFSGCRAARDGNCDVSVELSITGPDGKPYGETLRGPIWKGPPAPQYTLQLGQSGLRFILEPQDKLGTYLLQAKVTDEVAGTALAVEQAVTAAKS
jgi:hypothetical protein